MTIGEWRRDVRRLPAELTAALRAALWLAAGWVERPLDRPAPCRHAVGMSRFEGSISITNNPGTSTLVVVPISVNTRSALDQALIAAATSGQQAAQQAIADWDGAVAAVNS